MTDAAEIESHPEVCANCGKAKPTQMLAGSFLCAECIAEHDE